MALTIILIAIFIVILINILSKLYKFYVFRKTINKIPGDGDSFFGTAIDIIRLSKDEYYRAYCQFAHRYKEGIYKFWLANEAVVHIYKPEYVQAILNSSTNISKSFLYDSLIPWIGNGLLTSNGSKWFHDRKLINPAFHFSMFDNFIKVMTEKSDILMDRVEKELGKNLGNNAINIYPLIIDMALDVICESTMGVNVHAQDGRNNNYSKHIRNVSDGVIYRRIRPWFKFDWIFALSTMGKKYFSSIEEIHRFDREVIRKRKEARRLKCDDDCEIDDIGRKTRKSFLDILLDIKENTTNVLSDEDIREQVNTLMSAGHDTTSASIFWTLFCLATEPEIQDKVYEEIKDVFDDLDGPINANKIFQLKYLEMVCKETLRLYPIVLTYSRKITEEITIGKYVIPENTTLVIHVYGLHHDPEIWTNPDKFDPDRFLPDETQHRNPHSFVPFSGGLRNCIGQKFAIIEQKLVIAKLMQKWIVKSTVQRNDVKMYDSIVLQPLDDVYLYFIPRK